MMQIRLASETWPEVDRVSVDLEKFDAVLVNLPLILKFICS